MNGLKLFILGRISQGGDENGVDFVSNVFVILFRGFYVWIVARSQTRQMLRTMRGYIKQGG